MLEHKLKVVWWCSVKDIPPSGVYHVVKPTNLTYIRPRYCGSVEVFLEGQGYVT